MNTSFIVLIKLSLSGQLCCALPDLFHTRFICVLVTIVTTNICDIGVVDISRNIYVNLCLSCLLCLQMLTLVSFSIGEALNGM